MITDNHAHQPWFPGPNTTPQTMFRTALTALLREAQALLTGPAGAIERLEYQELIVTNFDAVMDETGRFKSDVSLLRKLEIKQNIAFMANHHLYRMQPLLHQVREDLQFQGPLPDMILFRRVPRLLMRGDRLWCQAPVPVFWDVPGALRIAQTEVADAENALAETVNGETVVLEIHTSLDYPCLVQRAPSALATPYHADLRAAFADVLLAPSLFVVQRTYERRTDHGDVMFLVVRPQQPWETP